MYSDISIYRLKSVVDNGILIDIRDEEVFNKGHISKAINIPIYKLLSDPSFYLDEKKRIIFIVPMVVLVSMLVRC